MKSDLRRIILAAMLPLFFLFILYSLKILELGMDWDFTRLGIYPLREKGMLGIFTHPLVHSSLNHLFANTIPLFFLSWCLFFFYRDLAALIFFILWVAGGGITFLIGKPGWHVGASGLIYGLAFFLFFSGVLRKHVPLIAISLLVTFLYGGLIWNMFPYFARQNTSWEGHLSGAIVGAACAILLLTEPFEEQSHIGSEETDGDGEQNDTEELTDHINTSGSESTLHSVGHTEYEEHPKHIEH